MIFTTIVTNASLSCCWILERKDLREVRVGDAFVQSPGQRDTLTWTFGRYFKWMDIYVQNLLKRDIASIYNLEEISNGVFFVL